MDISAIDIGRNFLIDYYENLCSNPKGAYGYFKPSSQFNFAESSTSKSFSYVVGNPKKPLNLHEKYFEKKYIHVLSHDIQLSAGGGLLLIVIGKIVDNEDNGEQKDAPQFMQTFFLVPSYEEIDRGNFFILNSTFRFVSLLESDTKNSPIKKKVEENVSNGENKANPSSSSSNPSTNTNITTAPNTTPNTNNNAKSGENKKKDLIVKSKDKITILKKSSDTSPSPTSSSPKTSTTNSSTPTSNSNSTSDSTVSNSEKSDKEEEIITSNQNVNTKPQVVKTVDFQKKSFLEVVASTPNVSNTPSNNSTTKTAPPSNNNNNNSNSNNNNNNKTSSVTNSNKSSNVNGNNNNNNKEKRDKKNISPSSVFVRNVPQNADQYKLEEFFSKYGKIKYLDYLEEKRYAFVNFETVEESENLLRIFAKQGVIFEGKGLHVEKRREKRTNDNNGNNNSNNNNNKNSNNRKNK